MVDTEIGARLYGDMYVHHRLLPGCGTGLLASRATGLSASFFLFSKRSRLNLLVLRSIRGFFEEDNTTE